MSLGEKCEGGEEVKVKLSEKAPSFRNIERYDGRQKGRERFKGARERAREMTGCIPCFKENP